MTYSRGSQLAVKYSNIEIDQRYRYKTSFSTKFCKHTKQIIITACTV